MEPTSEGVHHLILILKDEDGQSIEQLLKISFEYDPDYKHEKNGEKKNDENGRKKEGAYDNLPAWF